MLSAALPQQRCQQGCPSCGRNRMRQMRDWNGQPVLHGVPEFVCPGLPSAAVRKRPSRPSKASRTGPKTRGTHRTWGHSHVASAQVQQRSKRIVSRLPLAMAWRIPVLPSQQRCALQVPLLQHRLTSACTCPRQRPWTGLPSHPRNVKSISCLQNWPVTHVHAGKVAILPSCVGSPFHLHCVQTDSQHAAEQQGPSAMKILCGYHEERPGGYW